MPAVARITDVTSHGGIILSCSPNVTNSGLGIARVGDIGVCPVKYHGPFVIVSGSGKTTANGKSVARITSVVSCGAVVVSGSSNWTDSG